MPVFVVVRDDPERRYETTRQMLDLLSMVIFFVSAVCGAAARPIVLLMFGARWEEAIPVFAILTLMTPVTAVYSVIKPLLTAAGRTRLVSHFAWLNAATIMTAAWFAAPFGLTVLAWALAARGVLGVGLLILALKLGLERPVGPMLRLCWRCLASGWWRPGLRLLSPLARCRGSIWWSSSCWRWRPRPVCSRSRCWAPRRVMDMTTRLHRALLEVRIV